MRIFGGSGSQKLTQNICTNLGTRMGASETMTFADGNTFVRILENVRGIDTYLVQSTVFPSNDTFMEALFYIDALKRASAKSVTAVIPYFSYAKGDKKDEPRVSIRARVCAEALESVGVDRIVTIDLHAPQIQGFFRKPVDNLSALPLLAEGLEKNGLKDVVIVSADAGFTKDARRFASYYNCPVAIADKRRVAHDDNAEVLGVLGDVDGKVAVIVDDFAISCKTLVETASRLMEIGATNVYAAITHGVFAEGASELLERSCLSKIFITDSIESQPEPLSSKVEVISVARLLSEAIRRIDHGESISSMFNWETHKPLG